MLRLFVGLMMLGLVGCRGCTSQLSQLTPAELQLTPIELEFPDTFIGQVSRRTVTLSNRGQQPGSVSWSTSAPFSVERLEFTLGGGESIELSIDFSPTSAGMASGRLEGSGLELSLRGTGLDVPQCLAETCHRAEFDVTLRQCVTSPLTDETSCAETCVVDGRCRAGTCLGRARDCSDQDACTDDACGSSGCSHSPRTCPAPTNPCKVATCDSQTGCGEEDANDGTLCGPDVCTQADVRVCIAGTCVTRQRPSNGRCQNTWMSLAMPARRGRAVTYDMTRQKLLAFGGSDGTPIFDDTWEFDGTAWSQRFPAQSPPPTAGAVLAYDSVRRRAVLFGGERPGPTRSFSNETWEWDGITWLARPTAVSPPARTEAALVYDSRRRKTVLFGGFGANGALGDTWEWDGVNWTQRAVPGPSARTGHALAFDERRGRVVLVGNSAFVTEGVWEWDGTSWTERQPSTTNPGPHARQGLTYDRDRQRVVMTFGATGPSTYANDVWEWDGADWAKRSNQTWVGSPLLDPHAIWDAALHRVTVISLLELFSWDGARWKAFKPSYRPGASVVFDSNRNVVVLFGGHLLGAPDQFASETWELERDQWNLKVTPTAPIGRYGAAMTFDRDRNRVVLFGGSNKLNQPGGVMGDDYDDTWEWDGTSWRRVLTTVQPPAGAYRRFAFIPTIHKSMLLTDNRPSRWLFDGTTWLLESSSGEPSGPLYFDETLGKPCVLISRLQVLERSQLDGASWTAQVFPLTGWTPPGTAGIGASFDGSRRVTLLHFVDTAFLPQTWEFDGSTVTHLQPRVTPRNGAMFYDSSRAKVMLHDGTDTWVYLP